MHEQNGMKHVKKTKKKETFQTERAVEGQMQENRVNRKTQAIRGF